MADDDGESRDPLRPNGSRLFQVLLIMVLCVLVCVAAEGLAWLLVSALRVAESVAGYHAR